MSKNYYDEKLKLKMSETSLMWLQIELTLIIVNR